MMLKYCYAFCLNTLKTILSGEKQENQVLNGFKNTLTVYRKFFMFTFIDADYRRKLCAYLVPALSCSLEGQY